MNADGGQARTVIAGMGELRVVSCSPGDQVYLRITVGSCVGLFLADVAGGTFGVAHVMLPSALRDDGELGKYADTALPELLRLMTGNRGSIQVRAFLVGGASMFESESHSFVADIGRKNIQAVVSMLNEYRIPIAHQELGGNRGRTATFNCGDATISVRTLQKPTILSAGGASG